MKPRRIGFLGYEGITALDLVGPMDVFTAVSGSNGFIEGFYELIVIGLTGKPFKARSGLEIRPSATLHTVSELDTLIIPGGPGSRRPEIAQVVTPWLQNHAPKIRRVASVCTGLYLLAPTGLVDGLKVTTHWEQVTQVAKRFPKLKVMPDAIFVKSGRYYTSAGITAGIDLALALVEEDCGQEIALKVARGLVVYLKRPGGQRQFSDPLRVQAEANDRFAELVAWVAGNLNKDLSVQVLAARCNLSVRHFNRLFKDCFGEPPAEIVRSLRMDQARTLLAEPEASVESIAAAVGFSSSDSFRRAFVKHFGVSPGSLSRRDGVAATL